MSETATYPQIRYKPEDGVFEAEVRDFSDAAIADADEAQAARLASRWAGVEQLAAMPGVHADSNDDRTVIWAEPDKLFAATTAAETLTNFLSYLSYLLPTYPEDGTDYVVGMEVACNRGVGGMILSTYEKYQQWLERGIVGEDVLRRALAAAVLPLRPGKMSANIEQSFWYHSDGEAEHAGIGRGNLQTSLLIARDEFVDREYTSDSGNPMDGWQCAEDRFLLRHVDIRRASGDSFGVLDAIRLHFMPDEPRLYDMQSGLGGSPNPRELGGYLLAMGVLADEASRYEGGRPIADMAIRMPLSDA